MFWTIFTVSSRASQKEFVREFVNVVLHQLEKKLRFIVSNHLLINDYNYSVDWPRTRGKADSPFWLYNSTKGGGACLGNREDLRTC